MGFLTLLVLFCVGVESNRFISMPPLPRYPDALEWPIIPTDLSTLTKEEPFGSAWERSGLFEGDIMTSPIELRNTLTSPGKRWPLPVPVFINGSDFDTNELAVIERSLSEIEELTCIRFRQYKQHDSSFIVVRGNDKGCWSLVGRKDGGQVVHLQRPQCVQHGIVVHEFLHALGLHHQQSSPDRDDFIKIHWENIKQGREYNFNKYSTGVVTTYDLPYDYRSIMHYSEKAFSYNGLPTITPLNSTAKIGQRKAMSEYDAKKIRYYYDCPEVPESGKNPDPDTDEDLDYDIDNIFD